MKSQLTEAQARLEEQGANMLRREGGERRSFQRPVVRHQGTLQAMTGERTFSL